MEITLVGKMDASAYSLKSLVPKVAEYIGDLSLLKLENSTLRLNYVKMEAETTAKILEHMEVGHALLKLGYFPYTNQLLNMDSENVYGIHGEVQLGVGLNTNNCDINLSGTGKITVTNRFVGLSADGDCHFYIHWWVLVNRFNAQGMSTAGYFLDHDRVGTFTIRFRSSADNQKEQNFSISASKNGLYLNEKKVF